MENITTATPSPGSDPRTIAISVLRRTGKVLLHGIKAFGSGMFDPMSCSAYWVVSSPSAWQGRK